MASIQPGMTEKQTTDVLGNPDGYQHAGTYSAYRYVNRLMSGWWGERSDYALIFNDGALVEYGPGQIRQRDLNGAPALYLSAHKY